jgi:DNA polymerase, archaea type
MWIIDSCYRDAHVELWERGETGRVTHHRIPWTPDFYFQLPDPDSHWTMLEALSDQYGFGECQFRTVYGTCNGYHVGAGRQVADAILEQTCHEATLYNVDSRPDHRYMAEHALFPCGEREESRFSPDFSLPDRVMEIEVLENPYATLECRPVRVTCRDSGRTEHLSGDEKAVIADLSGIVSSFDPDVILFPGADTWVPRIVAKAREWGFDPPFSRGGMFRKIAARSYWSYGRTEYREGSLIPDGRLLIDTRTSFNYREGGLYGVILASRLTGLCPNLAARFTPGTLISGYEVYEALRRGIAVPYRKTDAETLRDVKDLRACDRGGMMFQPVPGLYEDVFQIDFTSLYPAVIVLNNLSPETLENPGKRGFLPKVLEPLLELRYRTKQLKKTAPHYRGADSILKWMLVTCFGYTGYKNAKFGRIEVHEKITSGSRDILIRAKDIADEEGTTVIHGIVDCLWLQGPGREHLKARIEKETRLLTELESYDWMVFLPMPDGFGAYNRYYGRLNGGSVKIRGIASRRRDTPEYIRQAQTQMLDLLGKASSRSGINEISGAVRELYGEMRDGLRTADPQEMAIHRQVSRLDYSRSCPEASAVRACRVAGIPVSPGMEIGYVVRDAGKWAVELSWEATGFDEAYYLALLERAWREIEFLLLEAARE